MFQGKKEILAVSRRETVQADIRDFQKLDVSHISFHSSPTAWSVLSSSEDSVVRKKLSGEIEEYNFYISFLNGLEDFKEFFFSQGQCVSRNQLKNAYSPDLVDKIFSLRPYSFETGLMQIGRSLLFSQQARMHYAIQVNDSFQIALEARNGQLLAPSQCNGYLLFWNLSDDGRDMTADLFSLLYSNTKYKKIFEQASDDYEDYFSYDQARDIMEEPDVRLLRCYRLLVSMGYIHTYRITTDTGIPFLAFNQKSDHSIDLALVDISFMEKDPLIKERLALLLGNTKEEVKEKKYILTDASNRQYLSAEKGQFGGHKKLKKYGRFNCPSALNAMILP